MMRLLSALVLLLASAPALAAVVAPGLPALLAERGEHPVWIYFTDKGEQERSGDALAAARARLSERALARRAKARPPEQLVSWRDLPNAPDYIAALQDLGLEIRAESRWLGAVSAVVDAEALEALAVLPFVARLEALRPSARVAPRLGPADPAGRRPSPGSPYDARGAYLGERGGRDDPLDYGASLVELSQVNVPAVHELGYHGEGVVVGMLDTGFNLTHEALAGVDLLGAWDFINDDGEVANEAGDPDSQQNHGSMTLSTLGGHMPGSLIGPAFGASYYLAKTEDTSQEEPIEEDWWVEGIEWLESQGCDLVSSSLAYDDWYVFEDFDGNTAVTTIAADYAVSLGVVVLNSAGNYRLGTGHIAAPADGDSVIAVGAVDSEGEIAGFSSPGPTADGRIKPDLSAMGVSNNVVVPGSVDQYQTASGTSFACPLSAGVAALLLGAHPEATPLQIRAALRSTASQADAPDNDYGWGIIDALAALDWLQLTAAPAGPAAAPSARIEGNWPNPFNPSTTIAFTLERAGRIALTVHDARGRRLRTLVSGELAAGRHQFEWDGRDERGQALPSGVYLARLGAGGGGDQRKLLLVK